MIFANFLVEFLSSKIQFADASHSSEGHTRDIGSELWQILSEGFGEEITKRNFRAILKKGKFCNFSPAIGRDHVTVNNNLNICQEKARSPTPPPNSEQTSDKPHIDLGDAPEIFRFFDRTPQLATLENWITQDRTRLIALLGISGIGKTTLSLGLADKIKTGFDCIIYRSLRFPPPSMPPSPTCCKSFPHNPKSPKTSKPKYPKSSITCENTDV